MGVVFEAHDPLIGRTVALKTIRLEGGGTPVERGWLQERLFREARSVGALSHPNIVTFYDSGLHEELAFLTMEYVDGPTLQDRLAEGRMDRREVLHILRQAAAALDYAHQAGVVHRDIKPSNIMLHGTTVKIADFGIAKLTHKEPGTVTGLKMGTPSYMSPEQIRGQPADGRSDQFSLAVVAYEMVAGVKPFRGESLALVDQIVYAERPSARAAVPDLPAAVDEVLQRGLAKRGRDRYPTCTEFVRRLEEAFAAPQRPQAQRWRWVAGGALLFLLAAGSASVAPERHPSPRKSGVTLHPLGAPISSRHVVLHRDFDELGLRTEAFLDSRPSNPHHADQATILRNSPAQVSGLAGVATMAGGWGHSLAVENGGRVWAWGWDFRGQLGDASTANRLTPVQVGVSTLAGVTAVATGSSHSLALKRDGSVWAWGGNEHGELGDGTTVTRQTPIQVPGLSGIVAIAAGGWHSLALQGDGSVWAWGRNDAGQLGDGATTDRQTPVRVRGLSSVVAVQGGAGHSLAVKNDGSVWAWGANTNGQLGDGTTTDRLTPVRAGGLTGVVAVSAGAHQSVALERDGSVWAWGPNSYGELGDGTTTDRVTPVRVNGLSDVVSIAAGAQHGYALKRDGSVWAWGQNYYGALGDGTWTQRLSPVQVSSLSGVVSIAAGGQHGLALKNDGSLWTWGWNDYGQLGKESIRVLNSAGPMTTTLGATRLSGTAYRMADAGFPWIQFDHDTHKLVLHPGNLGTSQWAAALGFNVSDEGEYTINGAFQRANTYLGAGDGVDVAVMLDTDAAHPLWAGHITSTDPAQKPFSIRKLLLRGQVVRFVVYSGSQGTDGMSDETFLEASIDR
jgi:alpha-tubulin suppressor-like RCC1 family protein